MFDSFKNSIAHLEETKNTNNKIVHEFYDKLLNLDRVYKCQKNNVISHLKSSGIDYYAQNMLKIVRLRPFYKNHSYDPECFCQSGAEDYYSYSIKNFEKMKGYVSHSGSIDFEDRSFTNYEYNETGGSGSNYYGKEIYYFNNDAEKFILPAVIYYCPIGRNTLRSRIIIDVDSSQDFLLKSVLSVTDREETEAHFEFGIGDRSPFEKVIKKPWFGKNIAVLRGGYD